MNKIAVIGAGAAGCFFAIAAKRRYPQTELCIYEAGKKPLTKLALTGGGRCNLTNSFKEVYKLSEVYPRGEQVMKRALKVFNSEDAMRWFESEGVKLVTQSDQCVFPVSQDAMQIVRTLENLMRNLGVKIQYNKKVIGIRPLREGDFGYELTFSDGSSISADKIVTTVGGNSEKSLKAMLPGDIVVTPTVPSLFTLKIPDEELHSLMGVVVENAILIIAGTSFRSHGTLLVTDWGISGPATLRLSSYSAMWLAEHDWRTEVIINWSGSDEATVRGWITTTGRDNPKKMIANTHPDGIPDRLWKLILYRIGIRQDMRWADLGSKGINRLTNGLTADSYPVCGRASFKDEFVTCGGVALSNINLNTLESKTHPGLYFAGEVLDVDAVTGGFNLQAAWSMAMTVANHI